jgi:hypothetical protein
VNVSATAVRLNVLSPVSKNFVFARDLLINTTVRLFIDVCFVDTFLCYGRGSNISDNQRTSHTQ